MPMKAGSFPSNYCDSYECLEGFEFFYRFQGQSRRHRLGIGPDDDDQRRREMVSQELG